MANKTFREASKEEWYPTDGRFPVEKLDTGSLQRIADASERMAASCEVMAKSHKQLIEDRDRYKGWHEDMVRYAGVLERRIRSLKGVITRMRKERDGKK